MPALQLLFLPYRSSSAIASKSFGLPAARFTRMSASSPRHWRVRRAWPVSTCACVAVSDRAVNASQRFPLIAVVPVTGTAGVGALYPQLSAGPSGLTKASFALIDHLRSIDKRRIRRVYGQLSTSELAAIDQGLELFLGLGK
jgi:mRNA interferase MazF